jgi:DNA-3-methyladenine glycosylase I
MPRCAWAKSDLMIAYHDQEWGVPSYDDRHLFEMLILEGAQAGLSWETILNRREGYRKAFDNFDVKKVAKYDSKKKDALLQDPGIIRNRLKVEAAVTNAHAVLQIQKEFGSLSKFLWGQVGGKPKINKVQAMGDVPAQTDASDALSKELKKQGFKFVGSTICYAFMQAVGMVNDHLVSCPRYKEVQR